VVALTGAVVVVANDGAPHAVMVAFELEYEPRHVSVLNIERETPARRRTAIGYDCHVLRRTTDCPDRIEVPAAEVACARCERMAEFWGCLIAIQQTSLFK